MLDREEKGQWPWMRCSSNSTEPDPHLDLSKKLPHSKPVVALRRSNIVRSGGMRKQKYAQVSEEAHGFDVVTAPAHAGYHREIRDGSSHPTKVE